MAGRRRPAARGAGVSRRAVITRRARSSGMPLLWRSWIRGAAPARRTGSFPTGESGAWDDGTTSPATGGTTGRPVVGSGLGGRLHSQWRRHAAQIVAWVPAEKAGKPVCEVRVALRAAFPFSSTNTRRVDTSGPSSRLRMSLSIPTTCQPSPHRRRAHSDPIRPSDPVTIARTAVSTRPAPLALFVPG